MVRTRVVCVILLAVCVTLPASAQQPTAYTITCSSGTACKSGTIPVFTTTGGAAKIDSSIVSQSGTTISVAGSVSAKTGFDIGGNPFAFGSVSTQDVFLGFAGNSTMTGTGNTAVGSSAFAADTTGGNGTAVGASALSANTTGQGNSAFGFSALSANTTGMQNEAFGSATLLSNTTGSANAAFGLAALHANTTGNNTSAFGYGALYNSTTANQNEGFGYEALFTDTTGNGNAA